MIDMVAWMSAAKQGKAVGRCVGYSCEGLLFCPRLADGSSVPFHDRTERETNKTLRWYEADCDTCHASYAYPNGRTAEDATGKAARQQQEQRRGAQRVSELAGGVVGRD